MHLYNRLAFILYSLFFNGTGERMDYKEPRVCPEPTALQSDFVKEHYEEQKHQGLYYELAFKDATQPRGCKCITSNKTIVSLNLLQDDFKLQCAGKVYSSDLSFDLNVEPEKRGYMIGRWNHNALFRGVTFPNTIVDVGVNKTTGDYDWAIEFQCKQSSLLGLPWISYYGLNFYSKTYNDNNVLEEMLSVARKRGLGDFIDSGQDVYIVDHSNCVENH